jgi:VanZ family protein
MRKIRHGRAWVFLVLWIAVTAVALTVPIKNPPKVIQRGGDKIVHTALFTVMGVAAQAAAPWVSLLVTVPIATGLELAQKTLPWREYNPVDMAANLVGIVLGLACFELSARLVK